MGGVGWLGGGSPRLYVIQTRAAGNTYVFSFPMHNILWQKMHDTSYYMYSFIHSEKKKQQTNCKIDYLEGAAMLIGQLSNGAATVHNGVSIVASLNGFSTFKLFLQKKTNIIQKITDNNNIFIAFFFYHRAVVKKDHYMIHNIIPFCDAAVAASAVLQLHAVEVKHIVSFC